jgi:hypothetical protein
MPTPPAYQIPLYRADLAKIGRFIALWNQIESMQHMTVAACLKIGLDASEAIMATTSSEAKSNIYSSVCLEVIKDSDLRILVSDIVADIAYLVSYRNDLAHARWFSGDIPTGARSLKPNARRYDLSEIDQKIEEASILTNKAAFLLMKAILILNPTLHMDEPLPWRDKFEIGKRLAPPTSASQKAGRRTRSPDPPKA